MAVALVTPGIARCDLTETIERIKPSIVVVGTFKKTDSPQFAMRGSGFVIGDGTLIATNAHVIAEVTDPDGPVLAVQGRSVSGAILLRRAKTVATDREHDLAILRLEGTALPALKLRNSDDIREGQPVAFTGFPIGGALGFSPVTHRGIISAITPIALPGNNAQQLNEKLIKRLKIGTFNIFQLDATAYPGNSGSPVFEISSGDVIGVVNMVFVKGSKEAALSQPSGIAYAIPSNHLSQLINK
jgi:serine protease Do